MKKIDEDTWKWLTDNDEEKASEKYKEYKNNLKDINVEPIELPPEMTIGVEIESEGENWMWLKNNVNYEQWKGKDDSTLKKGIEVVSPILKPGQKSSEDIYVICNMLNDLGQKTSKRCGGHIHIGANYLTNKQSYVNLLALWGNAEKPIYIISNPPGEAVRKEGVKHHAMPISGRIEKAVEDGTLNLDNEEDLETFISDLYVAQRFRATGINFHNVSNEKNTIEFRVSNGTINPQTWIENINLFGGIVKAAEELTKIQEKPEEQRTEDEKMKIETFDGLCSGELEEKEILDSLLELTVNPERKEIYQERYEKNKKFYRFNSIERAMKKAVSRETIKPKDIGKGVFTEENAVTGMEMQGAAERLNIDRSREEKEEAKE